MSQRYGTLDPKLELLTPTAPLAGWRQQFRGRRLLPIGVAVAQSRSSRGGYGWHHQKMRRDMLAQSWGAACHFCGNPMLPGQPLDLDHTDDRRSYRGMTHRWCNRADGARKVNAKRAMQRHNPRSTDW